MQNKTFKDFGLSESTINALLKKGFDTPSAIQALVIPEFLHEQSNIIGQAQTGTGKTAAFSIPIIETLVPENGVTKALILTPTRELAVQVSDEIYSLIGEKRLRVLPVYGGQSIDQQIKNIKRGVDIVVGTPGRIIDLLERKVLNVSQLSFFVLDEADEMLNMGFVDDIELILKQSNKTQKMLFFSATMPRSILSIAKKYMGEFKTLKVENQESTTGLTEQIYFEVRDSDKFETLCRVLDFERDFYGIIFAKTKNEADSITEHLKSRGYSADAIHGDITQAMRNKTLTSFKNKKITILVATDVAARGIDVSNLTHVINYSIPNEAESYVHRIGRTGRAGNKGVAITFVTPREAYQLNRIEKATKNTIKRQKAPTVTEVINAKKEALDAFVCEIINEKDHNSYLDLATTLLSKHQPEVLLAALLRHTYGDEFLPESYVKLVEQNSNSTRNFNENSYNDNSRLDDQVKLFIAMGKKDGLNPRKLLEILTTQAKTPARKVRDVRILDAFSFITVPFDEAEFIMKAMNKEKNQRPLVTKAKK
ncbi:MAG: DEAD/DEAH box helicase [Proteobacteria bacterium]|jgi:ATP-dependent RNA helicase DeaD|nr:DEAD/DEAH box helicase [Pseudomonadota bacterium]